MAHDNTRQLTDVEWEFVYGELNRAGAACSKHPRLRGIVDSIFWVSRYKTSWTALPSSGWHRCEPIFGHAVLASRVYDRTS
jgi:hypothetical protein